MNILVVSQYYYPEQFRVNDICEALVENGHSVTVITGLPNYPEGKIYNNYRTKVHKEEIINGVKVIRCNIIARRTGSLFLAFNYISFMITGTMKVEKLREKFDAIYVYQMSPVLMGIPALRYKKKNKVPILLYCCDLWPESIKDVFKSEDSIIFKIVKRISVKIYQSCDLIGITSKPFRDYLNLVCGVENNKIFYLPQHAEDIYLDMDLTADDNKCIDFMFMGNIGMSQNIDCIIHAVSMIKTEKRFLFHFVGDGSRVEYAKNLIKQMSLENKFVFHGKHSIDEMPLYYKLADACILTLSNDNYIGNTMPAKLQGYMAAGKPVIAAIDGAAKEVIKESDCGICVDSGDYVALANAMKEFINNQDKYSDCGINGKNYFINNFTKEIHINNLVLQISNIVYDKEPLFY